MKMAGGVVRLASLELLPESERLLVAPCETIRRSQVKEVEVRMFGIQTYRLLMGLDAFLWRPGKEQDSAQMKISLGKVRIESHGSLSFCESLRVLPFPGRDCAQDRVRQRQGV